MRAEALRSHALRVPMLVTMLLAAGATAGSAPQILKVPDIHLPDLQEKESAIRFDQAPVTLVNFWATWCVPCREEMPQIERLSRKYSERGFRAVGIALQSGEAAEVRDFVEKGKLGVTYTLLMGNDAVSEAFGGIEIVPTTFLVGPGGRVLSLRYGVTEDFEANMAADIERHLEGAAGGAAGRPD